MVSGQNAGDNVNGEKAALKVPTYSVIHKTQQYGSNNRNITAVSPQNTTSPASDEGMIQKYRTFLALQQQRSTPPARLRIEVGPGHTLPPSSLAAPQSAPALPFGESISYFPVHQDSSVNQKPVLPYPSGRVKAHSAGNLPSSEPDNAGYMPELSAINYKELVPLFAEAAPADPLPLTIPAPPISQPTTSDASIPSSDISTLRGLPAITTSPPLHMDETPVMSESPVDISETTSSSFAAAMPNAQPSAPVVTPPFVSGPQISPEQYQLFLEWVKLRSTTVSLNGAPSQSSTPAVPATTQESTIPHLHESQPPSPGKKRARSEELPFEAADYKRSEVNEEGPRTPSPPPDDAENSVGNSVGWGLNLPADVPKSDNIIEFSESRDAVTAELLDMLSRILHSARQREILCRLKGNHAQVIIDYLYSVLMRPALPEVWLRRHCLIALYTLCKTSQLYPRCYILKDSLKDSIETSTWPVAYGGFSNIIKGKFGEKELCLKLVRLSDSNVDAMLKRCAKEAILWGQLNHPNIIPFYGVYYLDGMRHQLCLVSPWMCHGEIAGYLKQNPSAPRAPFVYDVVFGLGYLHDLGLIHSDLKGANILVNDRRQACITDFGMSFIRTDKTLSRAMATTTAHGFTLRWASPELFNDDARPTMASDIWALGCVCYEILTGRLPFHHLRADPQIMRALLDGKTPRRPHHLVGEVEKVIWKQAERCWARDPANRPKCQDILLELELAGILRKQDANAQRDAEHESRHFKDTIWKERDPVDIDVVKKVLSDLYCPEPPTPSLRERPEVREDEKQDASPFLLPRRTPPLVLREGSIVDEKQDTPPVEVLAQVALPLVPRRRTISELETEPQAPLRKKARRGL